MRSKRQAATNSRYGVSLIEALIAMSILVLILGAVLALQLQALRTYQDVVVRNWGAADASFAISLMTEDLQGAYRVIGQYTNRIYISRPKVTLDSSDNQYRPTQPLDWGDTVCYYLSDQQGLIYKTDGPFLWRWTLLQNGTLQREQRPLAANIKTLQFGYEMLPAPRQNSVGVINLLVRAQRREKGTTRSVIHTSRLILRNAQYGPQTNETGTYEEE